MRSHNLVFSQQSPEELVMNVTSADGQPAVSIRMQAADVENLTAALSHFRTNMTPEIARSAPDIGVRASCGGCTEGARGCCTSASGRSCAGGGGTP